MGVRSLRMTRRKLKNLERSNVDRTTDRAMDSNSTQYWVN